MSDEPSSSEITLTHRSLLIAHRLAVAVALLLFALNLWRYAPYLIDDTFISFRYAKNLVDGNGLVFNVGERVEGYTNFLFTLLAAACLRASVDPVIGTKIVSLASALLVVVILARLDRNAVTTTRTDTTAWLALAFLLPVPAFAYWAAASFETMLFVCIALLALALLQAEYERGRNRGAACAFVLLALTRPEGVFLFILATTVFGLAALVRGRAVLRRSLRNVLTFGVGYGVYFVWRYRYYGDLFPNTFRAKVTGGSEQLQTGLQYLGAWARCYPFLAATLVVPIACLSRRVRTVLSADALLVSWSLLTLLYTAYVVLVGGDFMPFQRFFVPLLPWCCLLLARLFVVIPQPWRARTLLLVFPLHVLGSYLSDEPYRAFIAHRTAVVGRRVGTRLSTQLAPTDLIAVNTAGALPYFAERPAIDMLGLTDATIAQRPVFIVSPGWAGHRRGWGAYVLDRQPRIVFFYNATGSREPFYLSDRELADNPYFRFFYTAKSFSIPPPDAADHTAVGRFLGFPFGFAASGDAPWRDLGLESRFEQRPLSYTVLTEGTTVAHYFEFDARDQALWDARKVDDLNAFLDAVIARWRAQPLPASDPDAHQRVDALCAAAQEKVQQHDIAAAKTLLSTAAAENGRARSPLVYQYIANVAVLDGDLFTAIPAQKEALRLAPDNALYRRNLLNLLQQPYREFHATNMSRQALACHAARRAASAALRATWRPKGRRYQLPPNLRYGSWPAE